MGLREYVTAWQNARFAEKHTIVGMWLSAVLGIIIAICALSVNIKAKSAEAEFRRRAFLGAENERYKNLLSQSIGFFGLEGEGAREDSVGDKTRRSR